MAKNTVEDLAADVARIVNERNDALAELEQSKAAVADLIGKLAESELALAEARANSEAWGYAVVTEDGRVVSIGGEVCVIPLVVNANAEELARLNARMLELRQSPPMRVVKLVAVDV